MGEHAAIVQYLRHAYSFPEGEFRAELEAIAREEMRHLEWLAEKVVELGGAPTLERGPAVFSGSLTELLAADVKAEEEAVALYRRHIAAIGQEEIRELLERIISDEEVHRQQFAKILEEAEASGLAAASPQEAGIQPAGVAATFLAQDVRHEYTAVLRYLHHSFTSSDCEASRSMEEKAIEEMKHLGWLAEKLADQGGQPEMEREAGTFAASEKELLAEEIADEAKAINEYDQQVEAVSDPWIKALLARISYHEKFHHKLLQRMKEEQAPTKLDVPSPDQRLTVGSLLGREHG